jgi:hypothetical protein
LARPLCDARTWRNQTTSGQERTKKPSRDCAGAFYFSKTTIFVKKLCKKSLLNKGSATRQGNTLDA